MADAKHVSAKAEFALVAEDDPKVVAERYVNRCVRDVMDYEVKLRQARADERRARAELARLS